MPRIRTFKYEFFTSEDVVAVSMGARLTWMGTWTLSDDKGRLKYSPRVIWGALWALEPEVTPDDVERWLNELERRGLMCRYQVGGAEYLHTVSWGKHQRINRPSGHRLCPPCPQHDEGRAPEDAVSPPKDSRSPHGVLTEDSVRTHGGLTGGTGTGTGTGTGSGSGKTLPHLSRRQPAMRVVTPVGATEPLNDAEFDEFWKTYPRRVGKEAAKVAWSKAAKKTDAGLILTAVRRYAEDPNLPDKKFIPHPATWLNQGRWDDEPCAPPVVERPAAHRDRAMELVAWANEREAQRAVAPAPLELTPQPDSWLSDQQWGL